MTQKEAWIEREAREARKRAMGQDDWGYLPESCRDDWRRVVAPYYPEPVADADTLEALAKVAFAAFADGRELPMQSEPIKKRWEDIVAAVLRAAKPYVDAEPREAMKQDLAWIGRHNAGPVSCLKQAENWLSYCNSRILYRFELPQPTPLRVPVDVEGLTPNERNELDNLRAECKRLRQWQDDVLKAVKATPEVQA